MWETLQRYRALDAEATQLFRRAVALLPLVRILLRLRGYKATQEWLQRRLRTANLRVSNEPQAQRVERTCRMVRAAQRYGVRSTCLDRSLTLWYLLQRQGIAAAVRVGVRKENEKFEAHAWVECEGVALNQPEEIHRHYAAFEKEIAGLGVERP
jgi:Transglutaminase-like superfamily